MSKTLVTSAYGRPPQLTLLDRAVPDPGPGQATLRVEAAALNPYELGLASGFQDPSGRDLPLPMAMEGTGIVTAVGDGAVDGTGRPVRVGDALFGPLPGAAAEEVTAHTSPLHLRPPGVDAVQVAGLLLGGGAAEHALVRADVRTGDTVVVHGAAGGVGNLVTQLALARGARVVGTAAERHHDWLRARGAIPVLYGDGLTARIRTAAPSGVDAAIDTVGTDEALAVSIGLLADPSRFVTMANFSGAVQRAGGGLIGGGIDNAPEIRSGAAPMLAEMIAAGSIEVLIAGRFRLTEAAQAYGLLATGHAGGKVIVEP